VRRGDETGDRAHEGDGGLHGGEILPPGRREYGGGYRVLRRSGDRLCGQWSDVMIPLDTTVRTDPGGPKDTAFGCGACAAEPQGHRAVDKLVAAGEVGGSLVELAKYGGAGRGIDSGGDVDDHQLADEIRSGSSNSRRSQTAQRLAHEDLGLG